MTLRLVGLMSVVLLLSLAAFGLLMSHYQEQVMAGLARTASDVGRAALRTLELEGGGTVATVQYSSHGMVWTDSTEDPGCDVEKVFGPAARGMIEVRGRVLHPGGKAMITTIQHDDEQLRECLQTRLEEGDEGANRFFINVEDVRAEADFAGGLVLTIPTLTPAAGANGEGDGEGAVMFKRAESGKPGDERDVMLAMDEIRLPIEVGHYRTLFDKMRSRYAALFVGVFVVGMVLSTGLATRFTRPIRKLDAGIRRLSAGDLDVAVQVEGKGEIGRLARAFNEMAGQLRVNRERNRELVRRDKLSALGRLAAGVAHDVRNPLHSIGLTLQHLSETSRPDNDTRAVEFDRSVEIIRGEIRRLDHLVGNFLRFAKSERHERERVDLGELLRETARLVQKEAERRNVELVLDIDTATPPVPADVEALRASVLNLVLNSFEAMPDGGRLTLELGVEGGDAVLEVADTGEGIPEEHREHVFDFAYTTREGGNGLGLAMVHHCVVEEHGGRVGLESAAGRGTRVRLALPVTPGVPIRESTS